jgi:hypothetical protein
MKNILWNGDDERVEEALISRLFIRFRLVVLLFPRYTPSLKTVELINLSFTKIFYS